MPNQLASQGEARTKEEKSQHVTEASYKGESLRKREQSENSLPSPAHALSCIILTA